MIRFGFFNSVNGDRRYDADDMSAWLCHLVSSGVFGDPEGQLAVTAGGGMTVCIAEGWAFVRRRWMHCESTEALALDAADLVFPRIDRIVVRCDEAARRITLAVRKGTPSGTPSAPSLTRTDDVYELSLAQITVRAGTAEITQADIADERPDGAVCGFVAGLIEQVDAGTMLAQFRAAYSDWFDNVRDEVKKTTIVRQYTQTVPAASIVPIGIAAYNPALDILNVYLNGERMMPDDFSVVNGSVVMHLPPDGTMHIEVLKSVDTAQAESMAVLIQRMQAALDALTAAMGGLRLRKLSAAEYESAAKDADTVYYVYDERGGITQYLGAAKIGGGLTPVVSAVLSADAVPPAQTVHGDEFEEVQ